MYFIQPIIFFTQSSDKIGLVGQNFFFFPFLRLDIHPVDTPIFVIRCPWLAYEGGINSKSTKFVLFFFRSLTLYKLSF